MKDSIFSFSFLGTLLIIINLSSISCQLKSYLGSKLVVITVFDERAIFHSKVKIFVEILKVQPYI